MRIEQGVIDQWINGLTDGQTDGWTDGRKDGRTDEMITLIMLTEAAVK